MSRRSHFSGLAIRTLRRSNLHEDQTYQQAGRSAAGFLSGYARGAACSVKACKPLLLARSPIKPPIGRLLNKSDEGQGHSNGVLKKKKKKKKKEKKEKEKKNRPYTKFKWDKEHTLILYR
jgi:hypothetical protein